MEVLQNSKEGSSIIQRSWNVTFQSSFIERPAQPLGSEVPTYLRQKMQGGITAVSLTPLDPPNPSFSLL